METFGASLPTKQLVSCGEARRHEKSPPSPTASLVSPPAGPARPLRRTRHASLAPCTPGEVSLRLKALPRLLTAPPLHVGRVRCASCFRLTPGRSSAAWSLRGPSSRGCRDPEPPRASFFSAVGRPSTSSSPVAASSPSPPAAGLFAESPPVQGVGRQ